jgi:hypothetical protein
MSIVTCKKSTEILAKLLQLIKCGVWRFVCEIESEMEEKFLLIHEILEFDENDKENYCLPSNYSNGLCSRYDSSYSNKWIDSFESSLNGIRIQITKLYASICVWKQPDKW